MAHTLLLADDNQTSQRLIELTFADEDISVVAVSDGDHAIAALTRTPPDIVLADVDMPGRSGYEIARHMKQTPALAHIPVLLITRAFEPVNASMMAEIGCAGVLTKPFEPQVVIRRVRELLQGYAPAAAFSEPTHVQADPEPQAEDRREDERPPERQPEREIEPAMNQDLESTHERGLETASAPAAPAGDIGSDPMADADDRDREPLSMPQSRSDADVESYFEQLDQAFASLVTVDRDPAPSSDRQSNDSAGDPSPEASLPPEAPRATLAAPHAEALHERPRAPVPDAPRASLADAFTALLSAERASIGAPAVPTPRLLTALEPAISTDDIVERVTRRALERLSEESVRGMVERIVSETAERLIREEIERIKSNII